MERDQTGTREKFSFETDGRTDGQVHVLSCAFATKRKILSFMHESEHVLMLIFECGEKNIKN